MKKSNKKGFTIVELVIVIAVIAILAAVLIPTFSGLVKKANLSSDQQAVKQMNTALKIYEGKNGKPDSIDKAMNALEEAGYSAKDWQPLSKGYIVYWYETENVCILYNSDEESVAYPEEYKSVFTDPSKNGKLHRYNASYLDAMEADLKPDANGAKNISYNENVTLEVKKDTSKVIFKITATESSNAADQQAQMGKALYTIFTQIANEEKRNSLGIDDKAKNVEIVLPAEKTVDISAYEWNPIDKFSGTIKSTEDGKSVTIKGLSLTSSTSYSESQLFPGNAKYFATGFISTVSGTAVIKDLTFTDIKIVEPAKDINNADTLPQAKTNNVTGVIGAIIAENSQESADITIENVHATGEVTGCTRVGGLIGYLGGTGVSPNYNYFAEGSKVTIKNCSFSGKVTSTNESFANKDESRGTAAGFIGFLDKCNNNVTITIENCKCDVTVNSKKDSIFINLWDYKGGNLTIKNAMISDKSTATTGNIITVNPQTDKNNVTVENSGTADSGYKFITAGTYNNESIR